MTTDIETTTLKEILAAEARSRDSLRAGGSAGDSASHSELDELSAYLAGELDGTAEDALRSHLVACRVCTAELLDLETLSEPEGIAHQASSSADRSSEDTTPEPVDLAKVVAWRALSERRRRSRRSVPRFFGLLAAALMAAVAMAYVLAPYLRPSADIDFQENLPIHYLDELTRSRSFERSVVEVDADARYWVLILTPPPGKHFPRYAVELRAQDAALFQSEELVRSDHGALRLGIPRARVAEGEVELRLSGVDGERRVLLEEYALQIRYH